MYNPYQKTARFGNAVVTEEQFAQMCAQSGVGQKAEVLRCIRELNGGDPQPMSACDMMTERRRQAEAKICFLDDDMKTAYYNGDLQLVDGMLYSKVPITTATGQIDFFRLSDDMVQGIRNVAKRKLPKGEIFIATDIRIGYGVLPAGSNGGNVNYFGFREVGTGTDTNNTAGTPDDLTSTNLTTCYLDPVLANSELYIKIATGDVIRYADLSWVNNIGSSKLPLGQRQLNSPLVIRSEKDIEVSILAPETFSFSTGFAVSLHLIGFKMVSSYIFR